MSVVASLLLITALSIPTNTLVLRSGQRIRVEGNIVVEQHRVLFHSDGGYYSVSLAEVDFNATQEAAGPVATANAVSGKLRVSAEERERLIRELEENHSGSAAPTSALEVQPGPTTAEREHATDDEWSWRNQSRAYEEAILRAQENLDLLRDRAAQLQARILGFLSLGFKPDQFTYDSTQLTYTLDSIPQAELEVARAQRAYDQFRDEARRRGVTPGWLR